jgi:DNA-binding LytR/AlgR family response regulator
VNDERCGREALLNLCEADDSVDEVAVAESGATDCLTKPVSADRIAIAIERVRERGESRCRRSPARLIGENSHRLYFLAIDDVDYIEAYGNYVLIHVGEQKYVRRDTIKRLAFELRDAEFEWIRRSTLINLARVAFAERLGEGALAFTLISGTRLISRTRIRLEVSRGRPPLGNVV